MGFSANEKVLTRVEGHLFWIVLNRPEVRNCVDGEMAELLCRAWKRFRDDEALYVAIVTGEGESFCAGADLKQLTTLGPPPEATPWQRRQFVESGEGYLGYSRQVDLFKPILCAVHGYCVAGGLELACLADLRIAAEDAVFSVACRRVGVPLVDGGTQRLPRILGLGWALELILTGKEISAQEAYRIGLVNEVVPKGELLERVQGLAQSLCELPQTAMRTDKAAALMGFGRPLAEGLRVEAEWGEVALSSEEFRQAVADFFARKRRKS